MRKLQRNSLQFPVTNCSSPVTGAVAYHFFSWPADKLPAENILAVAIFSGCFFPMRNNFYGGEGRYIVCRICKMY